jgi:hypothetical protein
MNTQDLQTTQNIGEHIVTFYFSYGINWAGYVIHKEGNDYYEKSGGVCIENGELIDFDGTFSLPVVVAEALKQEGIKVDESFTK